MTLNWKYSEFPRKFVYHVLTAIGAASRLSTEGKESGHSVSAATGTVPGTQSDQ